MSYWPVNVKFQNAGEAAPSSGDNLTSGYEAGSWWIDTSQSPPGYYVCLQSTLVSALWMQICACGSVSPIGPTPESGTIQDGTRWHYVGFAPGIIGRP